LIYILSQLTSSLDPPVCYSERTEVQTVNNVTSLVKVGYFVCPYDVADSIDSKYCCGPALKQTCCKFWEQ